MLQRRNVSFGASNEAPNAPKARKDSARMATRTLNHNTGSVCEIEKNPRSSNISIHSWPPWMKPNTASALRACRRRASDPWPISSVMARPMPKNDRP